MLLTERQGWCAALAVRLSSRLPPRQDGFPLFGTRFRPVRERTWRKRIGGERQNVDEICVLCGLGALEVLSENAREELWQAVEESIRDGLQTDDLPQPNSFWARALVRVFRYFPRNEAESPEMQTKRLSTAILPYVKSDAAFLSLIVSLSQIGWPLAALHSAVREAGIQLNSTN